MIKRFFNRIKVFFFLKKQRRMLRKKMKDVGNSDPFIYK